MGGEINMIECSVFNGRFYFPHIRRRDLNFSDQVAVDVNRHNKNLMISVGLLWNEFQLYAFSAFIGQVF